MKKRMALPLTQPIYDPIDEFVRVLMELIDCIDTHKKNIADNFKFCHEIRQNRKMFEKSVKGLMKKFPGLSEKEQIKIEKHFYQRLNDLEKLVPTVVDGLQKDNIFLLSTFLIREVKKTLTIYKSTQGQMSNFLYPDPTNEILNDPALYKQIVDAWGEDTDEY